LHAESLPTIPLASLLRLIDHSDIDVAGFAAEILNNPRTVSSFPMSTWMGLLATRNSTVVATICQAFRKHVSFERVTLSQAIELAARLAVPVAGLGLDLLATKSVHSENDHRELAKLSLAQCRALGKQIAEFAVARLNVPRLYRLDELTAFFDSKLQTMREGSFAALAEKSPAAVDPAFWARLFESPYDDVRFELVDRLSKRASLPGASTGSTANLWQSVLLNINRGGRAKLKALRQIAGRIASEPSSAGLLLPVLAIAIRSVRPPEARHGLAAIVTAVERDSSLEEAVRRELPELILDSAGAAR
jgi:hypothetical protein